MILIFTSELLNDLRMKLKGPLILQGDAGYDECRSIWNSMVEKKPANDIYCYFDNDDSAYAVYNAITLKEKVHIL